MTDSPTRDDTTTPKSERSIVFDREYFAHLDFDSNKIWLPPGTEDEMDDQTGLFDEIEDRYEVGTDSDSGFVSDEFVMRSTEVARETSNETIHTHFRALVSQLLNGEGFSLEYENFESYEGWLEIVSSLAWLAANFVKPDTKNGGNMDPGYYVKVKCIASGKPSDRFVSKLIQIFP
jgi:1-phosphatidylinositol-3-phosphate 5-kinase